MDLSFVTNHFSPMKVIINIISETITINRSDCNFTQTNAVKIIPSSVKAAPTTIRFDFTFSFSFVSNS